jgi:hypothetical protein
VKQLLVLAVLCAAFALEAQQPPNQQQQQQRPQPTADPYANNPDAGTSKFPLAAPAGVDSIAKDTPPAGAVNTGPFNPAAW